MQALHRGHHDDAALLARYHLGSERTQRVGGAIEVVFDHVVPVAVLHLQQRHPALDGGIGNDNVDFAEALLHLVCRGTECGNVADVRPDRKRLTAIAFNHLDRLSQFIGRGRLRVRGGAHRAGDVQHGDVRPVGGELHGDGAADPARRSRHQCAFANQARTPARAYWPGRHVGRRLRHRLAIQLGGQCFCLHRRLGLRLCRSGKSQPRCEAAARDQAAPQPIR